MTDKTEKTEETKSAPPVVTPFAAGNPFHKNPAVGPTTNNLLREWRKSRDYEQFNPTAEK